MEAPQRYSIPAIVLHWLTAALILATVIIAWLLDTTDTAASRNALLAIHKSIGITIFTLAWIRLGWRIGHAPPGWPVMPPLWQRAAAWMTHVALYLITLTMPVSGYISAAARARETTYFGLFTIPQWVSPDRGLATATEQIHEYSSWGLYALVSLHLAAVLYHHVVKDDGLLQRMWPKTIGVPAAKDPAELPVSADY